MQPVILVQKLLQANAGKNFSMDKRDNKKGPQICDPLN